MQDIVLLKELNDALVDHEAKKYQIPEVLGECFPAEMAAG